MSALRQESTDTIGSHYSVDADYNPYEEDGMPTIKKVPRVPGHHPNRAANRAATKIQSLLRGYKSRVRDATMRNAQANTIYSFGDMEIILKYLEDCHSEKARLEEQLEKYEGERKKGGKRRRRKTRRKTRRKKSKSKRKTKRRRKSSKRRRR